MVKTFLEAFRDMEPRLQKAHLQAIFKVKYVSKGKIKLESKV